MNLRKRISKLHEEGRQVELSNYSLFTFEGYRAAKAARNFWWGAAGFVILGFFIFLIASSIYAAQQRGLRPELVRENVAKDKWQREDLNKAKQLYINGCKEAGTRPTDMSDFTERWKCQ